MKSLNIVFAGTPEFTLPCLDALAQSRHHLQAIYTQPDRPAGRGRTMQASAVKIWATTHRVPVYQPINFKSPNDIATLASLHPDILVVIAYGLILPQAILDIPRLGCINVHASSLPNWRGASPIQHAILRGDETSGITIMQMDAGMDTGDMLAQVNCPVYPVDTSKSLHDRLAALAVEPLLETLDLLATEKAKPIQQDHQLATYASKIKKDDAAINWHQPALIIDRQIRAYNPWPVAYTNTTVERLRIHQAHVVSNKTTQTPGTILSINKQGMLVATGNDALMIEQIQFAGSSVMSVKDWLNGTRRQLEINMVLT